MASLTSLINHSCFPNADRCFTNNRQIVFHAILPIKKGEQVSSQTMFQIEQPAATSHENVY